MFLSLFGLIILQGLWIKYAIETEKAKFDQLVYDAMKTALSKVDQRNVFEFIDEKIELPEPADIDISLSLDRLVELEDVIEELKIDEEFIQLKEHEIERDIIFLNDSLIKQNKVIIKTPHNHNHNNGNNIIIFNDENNFSYSYTGPDSLFILNKATEGQVFNIRITDSIRHIKRLKHAEQMIEKEELVKHKLKAFNENIEQWVMEYSFDEDLNFLKERLISYGGSISAALQNNGIKLNFDYQILKEGDSTISVYSSLENNELIKEQFKTEIFAHDIFTKDLFLVLNFPGKNSHIYSKVFLLVLGSVIFIIIILITFGTTLYYIRKQKKLSEVKSDFINNMTHEFKTPIATIRLAADAMESPKVMGIQKSTLRYLNIIRQENKRMNNQVERVLQMALIDEGQLQIDIQENDLHSIIQNCINVVELIAHKKNGKISSSLRASCFKINIDEVHMANVLNNLLDNAIKYCTRQPDIIIETYNKQGFLFIRVSDNGIGMSKDVQKHIFDKFYRKPTGNIHNIKGFGLGLSYVKAIIDAHGGEISVTSEPDNGSTFLLKFNCSN